MSDVKDFKPMGGLRYVQGVGFSPIESVEAELNITLPESWGETVDALGRDWTLTSILGGDLDYGPKITIIENRSLEKFVVEWDDYSEITWVLVDGMHNMLAFRLALAPLLQMYAVEHLLTHGSGASARDFKHRHGHESDKSCRVCETWSERHDRQEMEQKQRERARSKDKADE
jgi:hypothetical protein